MERRGELVPVQIQEKAGMQDHMLKALHFLRGQTKNN